MVGRFIALKMFADAWHAVHDDAKGHSGYATSTEQTMMSRSSFEAKLNRLH